MDTLLCKIDKTAAKCLAFLRKRKTGSLFTLTKHVHIGILNLGICPIIRHLTGDVQAIDRIPETGARACACKRHKLLKIKVR